MSIRSIDECHVKISEMEVLLEKADELYTASTVKDTADPLQTVC